MKACEPYDMAPATVVANRFAIQQKVQSGGMGTIYRARDLQTDEPVALRMPNKTYCGPSLRRCSCAPVLTASRPLRSGARCA